MENTYEHQSAARILAETVDEKCMALNQPGRQVEFDPEEADMVGAFREYALSEADASDATCDDEPY